MKKIVEVWRFKNGDQGEIEMVGAVEMDCDRADVTLLSVTTSRLPVSECWVTVFAGRRWRLFEDSPNTLKLQLGHDDPTPPQLACATCGQPPISTLVTALQQHCGTRYEVRVHLDGNPAESWIVTVFDRSIERPVIVHDDRSLIIALKQALKRLDVFKEAAARGEARHEED